MTDFVPRHIAIDGVRTSYRTAGVGPPVLCVHGYPRSSDLWRAIAPTLSAVSTVIAPDLPGFGDSELGAARGTWEDQVSFLERFVAALGYQRVDLVVHDFGGLIGLRWACDFPTHIDRLVIMDTGFFPDGRWHDHARIMRSEGAGETLMNAITPERLTLALRAIRPALPDDAIAECWKAFATAERRAAKLALYRSADFAKLEPYRGRLAALARPTLVLWGAADRFVPPAAARRFAAEIPAATVEILSGAGHFLQEDAPAVVGERIRAFLHR